jgi:hypothetical protein
MPGQRLMYLEADSDVIVQSGVKWDDLNRALAEKGIPLFFPVCIVTCGNVRRVRRYNILTSWILDRARLLVE